MRPITRITQRKAATPAGTFVQPPSWDNGFGWAGPAPTSEQIGEDFEEMVHRAYKSNGVVFACMMARQMLFSEARFAYRRHRGGRPSELFGTPDLRILERPYPGGVTGDLLGRMIQDADLAGNAFNTLADDQGRLGGAALRAGDSSLRIARLTPSWVRIVLGSKSGDLLAPDTKPIALLYRPPGSSTETILLPSEVSHFAPIPDPAARFRGMSWLTPIVNEIAADKSASRHKLKFFDNGATLSTIVRLDKDVTPTKFTEFVAKFRAAHDGVDNAYKTLFVGGGADVTLNGANMQQIDFKATQGAGETRIASAAGMHPVIVGLSEGLAGSSLNEGNFKAAIRLTGDKTIRPLWRSAAACLESLVKNQGSDVDLWYDDREVAFLRDDTTDVAEIQAKQAATARQLVDAGYEPTSVIQFLETGNLTELKHSGLYSVQLQRPGAAGAPPAPQ